MAVTGYMTELDTESIWSLGDFDTTRFGKINVRIAEILNFLVHGDASTDITDTTVKPILEQISEEIFIELTMAAKGSTKSGINPWDFIMANVSKIGWRYYDRYLLRKVRIKLGKQHLIKYSNKLSLPSHSD